MRENRMDLVQAFDEFLIASQIQTVPITVEITNKALDLQQQMHSLKAFDALQLGTAYITTVTYL